MFAESKCVKSRMEKEWLYPKLACTVTQKSADQLLMAHLSFCKFCQTKHNEICHILFLQMTAVQKVVKIFKISKLL